MKSGFWTRRPIQAFRIPSGWSFSSTPPKIRGRRSCIRSDMRTAVPGRTCAGQSNQALKSTYESDCIHEDGPRDVFQLKEITTPTPADNEVLIKVCAASVNPLDWKTMRVPSIVRLVSGGRLTKKNRSSAAISQGEWKRWETRKTVSVRRRSVRGNRFLRGSVCRVCVCS